MMPNLAVFNPQSLIVVRYANKGGIVKSIKFDLPINGTKVKTLEDLRDNITSELLDLGRQGKLAKWFRSRELEVEASGAEQANNIKDDVDCFIALCKILSVEIAREDAELVVLPPPPPGRPLVMAEPEASIADKKPAVKKPAAKKVAEKKVGKGILGA